MTFAELKVGDKFHLHHADMRGRSGRIRWTKLKATKQGNYLINASAEEDDLRTAFVANRAVERLR